MAYFGFADLIVQTHKKDQICPLIQSLSLLLKLKDLKVLEKRTAVKQSNEIGNFMKDFRVDRLDFDPDDLRFSPVQFNGQHHNSTDIKVDGRGGF